MNIGGFSALVESHQAAFAGDSDALPLDVPASLTACRDVPVRQFTAAQVTTRG
jgi:hypothetical protein